MQRRFYRQGMGGSSQNHNPNCLRDRVLWVRAIGVYALVLFVGLILISQISSQR
jgi:hypothetical protein